MPSRAKPPTSSEQPAQRRPPEAPADTTKAPGDEAPPGAPGTGEGICRICGGSGRLGATVCFSCQGSGTVTVAIGGA